MDSYTKTIVINTTPQKLYQALTTQSGLAKWWTKQTEIYLHLGGTATFRFEKDTYVVMKINKLNPNKEVIWKCVEQHFQIEGTDKTDEWVGTSIKFTLTENKDQTTTLNFTHDGLIPELFCYKECVEGWDYFLKSLKDYLETGQGTPYVNK